MISEAFANDDPLARSQSITTTDFYELIDRLYDNFIADRLSQVAVDIDSNRVAAVIFAEVHRPGPGDEGSNAIAALIDTARKPYFAKYKPRARELMHIHFIASDPDYRRQQLVRRLIAACLDEARLQGYQKVMVEASGNRSRALLQKHFEFQSRVTIEYANFEWDGGQPFSTIAEHGGLTLMDKSL